MNITTSFVRKSVLFGLILFLTACVSHQQYRSDYQLCVSSDPEEECQSSALQEYKDSQLDEQDYLLAFVEFDDQGQLWHRKQLHKVLDQLHADSANQDMLLVVFVHGWKHSAMPKDSNIHSFRKTLKRLSAMETAIKSQTGDEPRKIAGLYLGWRGGSVSLPFIENLTFWDRKNTAHTVGYGGVTEVLSRLELLKKTRQAIAENEGKESATRLIVVGHSFGGAVVYSALSEILENGFVQTRGPAAQVSDAVGYADLVVLINPAFEAMRYSNLSDLSTERRTYFPSQLPVLAVLTSEADYATKFAFPAGRWFSTLFEKERDVLRYNPVTKGEETIDQGEANVTTVGHFDGYKTHYLKATPVEDNDLKMGFDLSSEVAFFMAASDSWENDHPGSKIDFKGSTLERTLNSAGRNPYLNIYVDRALISGHNHIEDPRIQSFIRQLILISSQSTRLENR